MPAEDLGGDNVLNCVVSQRLLPLLCPNCKRPATDAAHGLDAKRQAILRNKYQLDPGTMYVANPHGCEACRPRGIGMRADGTLGMTVAVEILLPDAAMRDHIVARDWRGLSRYFRSQRTSRFDQECCRGKTAFEHALYLASLGRVSVLDIEASFEPLALYEVHPVAADKEQGASA